jgi:heme/copper-type cytochrome/quinol oxidase subunit 2
MKKCNEDRDRRSNALLISTITSAVLSVCVLLGVLILSVMRVRSNRKHDEKWRDYDECGI